MPICRASTSPPCWARSGLLALTRDAGAPPTLPVGGSGDHSAALSLYGSIVTALYRRERTGKGSSVTTSLLASGVWSTAVPVQGALNNATFYPLHDRQKPPNPILNVYKSQDDAWFLIAVPPDHWPTVAKSIGRPDLLTDERYDTPAHAAAHTAELTGILDDVFGSQPVAHWQEVFEKGHLPFGRVRGPQEVPSDPQLRVNDIVVPLDGAGPDLTLTVSSRVKVHGVDKVAAKRGPDLGEHNTDVLRELGFDATRIESLEGSGVVPTVKPAAEATR